MRWRQGLAAVPLLALLLACSGGSPAPGGQAAGPAETKPIPAPASPGQAPTPTPAPARPDPDPQPGRSRGTPAAHLFPERDLRTSFRTWDLGPDRTSIDTQLLLREPDRVRVIYNGRPYATWRLGESGVWREDPANPGTLLRYLPPDLQDGLAWSQPSGDATVWFQLARAEGICPVGNGMWTPGCWQLTVLSRGEELRYTLAPQHGPVQVWSTNARRPEASFFMELQTSAWADLTAGQRAALLAGPPDSPLTRPPVTEVPAEEFAAVRQRELGLQTARADLDGDGTPEVIGNLLPAWNMITVEVTGGYGFRAPPIAPSNWAHRLIPVRLSRPDRTVLLEWRRYPGGSDVGVRILVRREGALRWIQPYGWGLKHAITTAASRAVLSEDGILTVEWEMGDPARHTRVRQYELRLEEQKEHVRMLSETLRPQGETLRRPTNPEEVLRAALVASIHDLEEELGLYIPSREVAEAFRQMVRKPAYELVSIHLAKAGPPDPYCVMRTEPVRPGADGTAPFLMEVGGSPTVSATLGSVRFGADAAGNPVIIGFEVTGRCPSR